jgi:methylmalonyl-CoA mutase N-terminal domain/subunit
MQGYQQREIQEQAYRLQRELETGERTVVGVNRFQTEDVVRPDLLHVDPEVGKRQRGRLQRVREERDNGRVERLLGSLRSAATGTDNLMPVLLDLVEAYASVGEICDVLRDVWGEQQESLVV